MTDESRISTLGKWIAGIVAAVIGGVVIWLITNAVFPRWFSPPPPPPEDNTYVECTAHPATVSPGGLAEITVKVMRDNEPVEGAAVKLSLESGSFTSGTTTASGNTYSGGVFRTTWRAPSPSAAGYVFPAEVDLDGVRTAKGEMHGHYRTNCQVLVRR